jgi:3-oxoacyl-[acyl-carrier protein] reductase
MIVITGASRGLGLAIASRLHSNGTAVWGLARHTDGLPFPSTPCDVADPEQVKQAVREIKKHTPVIQGLINAAGVASMNLALTTPPSTVQRLVATNLLGTIHCCQAFGAMLARNKEGVIINFSTIAVSLGLKGESAYVASKAGVEGFSRSFAREMGDFNVRVNCIAPGPIQTDLIKNVPQGNIDKIIEQQVLRKQFGVDAVCDVVEMLLDHRSSSLSGQVFHIGGA